MIFGIAIFLLGYALFYWGIGHFPGQNRHSLWTLLGLGALKFPQGPNVALGQHTPAKQHSET